MLREEWVETTPEIIDHFNKQGLGGARYFVYKGIKVCAEGELEPIQEYLAKTMEERVHGTKYATQAASA